MNVSELKFGLDTFGDMSLDDEGQPVSAGQVIRDVVEQAKLAEDGDAEASEHLARFLDQVFAISDRVTILRNGQLIGTKSIKDLTATEVVKMMLGKDLSEDQHTFGAAESATGPVIVEFSGLGKAGRVAPFNLALHAGEVVGEGEAGLAVAAGNIQRTLALWALCREPGEQAVRVVRAKTCVVLGTRAKEGGDVIHGARVL